jgi:hypothetical protein
MIAAAGSDVIDNTGDAAVPADQVQALDALYVPPAVAVATKVELQQKMQPSVDYGLAAGQAAGASGVTTLFTPIPCDGPCPPSSRYLSQPLVSQDKRYTCGPAATRLVLWQLTGVDPSEATLETEEHTKPKVGTYINSIGKVLNARQSQDTFIVDSPTDATHYMGMLTYDVWNKGHSLINNVFTERLTFWSGHKAYHYDVAYGYNHANRGAVAIAEEWDPVKIYGPGILSRYNNVNPYGYHPSEPLVNVWAAIKAGANKGKIIW